MNFAAILVIFLSFPSWLAKHSSSAVFLEKGLGKVGKGKVEGRDKVETEAYFKRKVIAISTKTLFKRTESKQMKDRKKEK